MEKIDKEYAKESIKMYEDIDSKMQNGEIDENEGNLGLNEFYR